ncbi:MAG TPA: HAD-IA family hydrolase [Gaiellaceae bacterium]|jgi:HAD superfamily hydrolase (TIGR01549 family)
MAKQATRPLALFDFDGTLCRLDTDYDALRAGLEELGGHGDGLLELILSLDDEPRARELVNQAELAGLAGGEDVDAGIQLYRAFASDGAQLGIVSHNGHAVIEAFLEARGLPRPDTILDRRALGGPKDESETAAAYAGGSDPVYVVGDADSDRRLAERLGGTYLDVGDELRSYYEARAHEIDELALTYESPSPYKRFFYRSRFRAVLGALDPQAGEEILEIGCGSGSYTRSLAVAGVRITATDYAPSQLAQARRNAGELGAQVVFRLENAQHLSFPDESFDKVLLSEVIEHVPEPERAVEEAARVLRPGGLLVVSTPSRFSPLNLAYGVKRRVRRYGFNEHLHELTPGSFRRLVGRHLDVESLEFANFVLPYPVDELYLRAGSPGLGLLRAVERGLAALPGVKRLGWTMVLRARKPA